MRGWHGLFLTITITAQRGTPLAPVACSSRWLAPTALGFALAILFAMIGATLVAGSAGASW